MLHARIDGYTTSTVAHPSLKGWRVVLCTPVDDSGQETSEPIAAIDPLGAGRGQRVIITTDGSHTQETVRDDKSPLRNQVIGVVD